MVKLNRKSRLSLILSSFLLLVTYVVEGWMYGLWMAEFLEYGVIFNQFADQVRYGILYGAAITVISLFVVILASPFSLMTTSLDGWLRSDTRAFLSIFVGAFAFAILVQRVDYFARFLVMVSAVFLVKLDLQLVGLSRWLCSVILILLCWLGFTGGILAFYS
ncbi:hypothetical protein IQ255_12105 [Pleurocapsales cyanobacterium LEGE 10410]|nr:hypothetical protein [Pleurocapsales cyanobacterium LEGE 10410]